MNILELRKIVLAALLAFAAAMMLQACSTTEEESSSSGSVGQPEPDNPLDPECVEGSPVWPACSYD